MRLLIQSDNDSRACRFPLLRGGAFCRATARMVLGLVCGGFCLFAQQVTVYVSSSAGDRIAPKPAIHFGSVKKNGSPTEIRIDESARDQTIIGFGASFLEAGMICINSLDHQKQEDVFRSIFDEKTGAGFSAMKTVNGATDFMSAGPFFTYDDTPGDVDLRHFSIQRDLGPNGLIPYIKRAQRYGKFVLQAPMDYPPDWMLYDVNSSQDVNPKYYDTLARFYVAYLRAYQKNGIFIDYLSLFNEPGAYTNISYPEIRDLLKNHVGPLFAKSGIKTKLQLSENPTRAGARKYYPVVLDDPEARKYVATLPYHGYDFTQLRKPPTKANGYTFSEFKNIAELHKMYPDLPLWMTEVCFWNRGTPWAKPLPRPQFSDGDFWGHQIMADLKAGASGWTYWNMILDQQGGPELISPIHHDGVDNKQQPLIIVNRNTKQVTYTGGFYYLAHFSKFIRPGFVRIGATCASESLDCVAFQAPDKKIAVEVINSSSSPQDILLNWQGKSASTSLPADSITTLLWNH